MIADWKEKIVPPKEVLKKIEPGMNIFIGTGSAEPRSLLHCLMHAKGFALQDLTLIQVLSFGDAISLEALETNRYRLKTFFSGWVSAGAIASGLVDLVPSRFSAIPRLMKAGLIPVDVVFVQITPPNKDGFCSLGMGVDVARKAMIRAEMVIGEINHEIPFTYGDTLVPFDAFDMVVESTEPPLAFPRFKVAPVFEKLAENVAGVIEDGSCLAYTFGPLFEALPKYLSKKKDLGIHSPFFTDALMELVKSGAVTNRRKKVFKGRSLISYALGGKELMAFLDHNPMVEFQALDEVYNPMEIGRNSRFVFIYPVRQVDLSGRVALHNTADRVTAGHGQLADLFNGAEISPGGYTIVALPSRNLQGQSNIHLRVDASPDLLSPPESIGLVATEYGVAHMKGKTLRERAQALIDIAHPDDRAQLIEKAKQKNLIYQDQIFLSDSARFYPADLEIRHTFKNKTVVRFRAIKPSDEDQMRQLFYRFSDQAIYYRYFSPVKTMPHKRMQEYVNVDYRNTLSIVGLAGGPEKQTLIAEARFVREAENPYVDTAFIVDEAYQGLGIASYLYRLLAKHAEERGAQGMTADVLTTNQAMFKVFEKGPFPLQVHVENGVYSVTVKFDTLKEK